ncbi:MAG: LytTR family DNA-binding domain-containing protein [Pseudomonadota bacterium]
MPFSAFIVDDEPMARGNLMEALRPHKRWGSLREFTSGAGVLDSARQHRPDVVFLDIQMPGEDGVATAKSLLALREAPLIVFVTAHSQYAVEAFELYAVDYLLKPFNDDRLAQCVTKLEHQLDNQSAYQRAQSTQAAWAQEAPLDRLVIKSSASVRIIDVAHIQWIAANGNYVDIHHSDGRHLLRASLRHVLSRLPPGDFIQVHRGYVARVALVREVKAIDGDRSEVLLSTGTHLPVGKSYKGALLERLCC